MTELETIFATFCELLVGPERSHPSELFTAIGPFLPRFVAPVEKFQWKSEPINK